MKRISLRLRFRCEFPAPRPAVFVKSLKYTKKSVISYGFLAFFPFFLLVFPASERVL